MNARKLALVLLAALVCAALAAPPAWTAGDPGGSAARGLEVESIRVGTKAGPLSVRVRAGVAAKVTIRVNGKRVRQPFRFAGKHAQEIELHAADGVRAGANRLRIRAVRHGRVYTAKRSVRVPRRALLADAGRDLGILARTRTRVGSGAAPASSESLRYRWEIAERPVGSRATLRGRDKARPILHAHTPGTYVLQLAADPDGAGPPSYDQVTVTATPRDLPIGVPIETINKQNGGITVAGETFGPGAITYVVLDRETRQPVKEDQGGKPIAVGGSVSRDAAGIARLNQIADAYGGRDGGGKAMSYLMIVSGRNGITGDTAGAFADLVKKLGAEHLTEDNFYALTTGVEFSLIGIPGAPAGAANVRIPGVFSPKTPGGIGGYLQANYGTNPGGQPYYEYVSPEHPKFDTRVPGQAANTNKMVIGDRYFLQPLPGNGQAGLHVVVVESLTLKALAEVMVTTNGPAGANDRALQREAADAIRAAIDKPGERTVFVQTVGKPKAAGPEWQGIVDVLGRLGANRHYVNALDGTTEYAFAGRLGSEAPPVEASTAYDRGSYPAPTLPPARLLGVLARSRTQGFDPNVTSTPTAKAPDGTVNFELIDLAYQPSQPWPELAKGIAKNPGEAAAAQTYICERIGFCQQGVASNCSSVRECFWQKFASNWTLKAGQLEKLDAPKGRSDFNGETFEAVRKQLAIEAAAVANVQFYLEQMQKPFDTSISGSQVNIAKISDDIWNSLPRTQYDNTLSWALGLVGKIVSVGGFAGPPYSGGAAGLAAVFGLASNLSNKAGQPIFSSAVKSRASQLGAELVGRVNLARKSTEDLGEIFVSDYGKLITASKKADGDWQVNPAKMVEPIESATKQWLYEALLPAAYPYLIRGNVGLAQDLNCELGSSTKAWPNQPNAFQMGATVGYADNGQPIRGIFFFTRGIGGGTSPSAAIGDEIFRPRTGVPNPGLGIEKMAFFIPRVFGGKILHAVNGVKFCHLGYLPSIF